MLANIGPSRKRNKRKLNTKLAGLWLALGLLVFSLNPVPASLAAGQDGTLDLTFKSGSGPNGSITALAEQPDGKLLVGGTFKAWDNSNKSGFVRLNPDGTLDNTFNSAGVGTDERVYSIIVLGDGKILIGGAFDTYNGVIRYGIAKLNSDGSLDTTFTPQGIYGSVEAIIPQSDGKILIAGTFTEVAGVSRKCVARLNADGSLDPTFDPGTGAANTGTTGRAVHTMYVQSSGKIVIGGWFTKFNEIPAKWIARLNPDGSVDTSFNSGSGANNSPQTIVGQDGGKMLVAGSFTTYNGAPANYFIRLNEDGSRDESFNSGVNSAFTALVLQKDGKILLGGAFSSYSGTPVKRIVRLNADGTLDNSFDPGSGPNAYVGVMLPLANNKLLIGGSFTSYDNQGRNYLAKLEPNGAFISSFGQINGANNTVNEIVAQPDGKILVGGDFDYYGGLPRKGIARLNSDGTPDTSFNPGTGISNTTQYVSGVHEIKVQPDGKIVLGGIFIGFNGTPSKYITRLNPDGSVDTSFNSGNGADSVVFALALQPDGKILLGGYFSGYNGTPINGIARLNSDGTLDDSFQPPNWSKQEIRVIIPQPNGKILVGGVFSTNTTPVIKNFVRLSADGSLDPTFNPGGTGIDYTVYTALLQPDGKILVGGFFTKYNDTPVQRLIRLNSDGSLDSTFNTGTGASREVYSFALQSNNQILVAGPIEKYNDVDVNGLTRLNSDGTLDTAFNQVSKPNNLVNSVVLQADGKILVGGQFRLVATSVRDRIARLENSGCNPLVVTNSGDDGLATNCGTFSHALLNASSGATITFALTGGSNTVTLSSSFTPTLKSGVTLDGGASGVILDGTSGAGLRLGGNNTLTNLTLRGFSGPALVATSPNTQNWLYRVKIEK